MNWKLASILVFACAWGGSQASSQSRVQADCVAVSGDVTNSTINCGPRDIGEKVRSIIREEIGFREAQQRRLDELGKDLGLTRDEIRTALAVVGKLGVPNTELGQTLIEMAEQLKDLRAPLAVAEDDDPKIKSLRTAANQAVAAGELDKADALLAEIVVLQGTTYKKLIKNPKRLAELLAQTHNAQGDVAWIQMKYREASKHYASAARALQRAGIFDSRWLKYGEKAIKAELKSYKKPKKPPV